MAASAATDTPPTGEGDAAPYKRLSYHQRALVLALVQEDITHKAIAAKLGCSTKSVQRVLALHKLDCKSTTTALMQTGVLDQLSNWSRASKVAATRGDHRPAKDWAIAAGAIDAQANTTVNLGFQVVVAPRPGLPDFTQPVLETANLLTTPVTQRHAGSDPQPKVLEPKTKRLRR